MGVIVGLDLSLSSSAVVILDTETGEIKFQMTGIGYGLSRGAPWWLRLERVKHIVEILDSICLDWAGFSIDRIVFEGPSLGSKGAYLCYIGELMGFVQDTVFTWSREIVEVAPTALKKFAVGKGNVKKSMIAAHVQKRWGEIFADDNLTDAYVLCQIGRAMAGTLGQMPKANMTVLKKVIRYVKDEGRNSC